MTYMCIYPGLSYCLLPIFLCLASLSHCQGLAHGAIFLEPGLLWLLSLHLNQHLQFVQPGQTAQHVRNDKPCNGQCNKQHSRQCKEQYDEQYVFHGPLQSAEVGTVPDMPDMRNMLTIIAHRFGHQSGSHEGWGRHSTTFLYGTAFCVCCVLSQTGRNSKY